MSGNRAHKSLQPPSNPEEMKGQTALPLTCPPYGGIKYQPLHHSSRIRLRQASTPHSGCDQGLIRQLRSLLRPSLALWRHCGKPRRCARCAQHCSNYCATKSPYFPCTFSCTEPSNDMDTALGSGPDLDQGRTPACRTLGALPRRTRDGTLHSDHHATRWSC